MTTEDKFGGAETLQQECRLMTRYLVRAEPDTYIIDRYVALQNAALGGHETDSVADDVLLDLSRSGLLGLHLADAYSRFFHPHCLLRHKLVLAFAILENSQLHHGYFTSGLSKSVPIALLRVAFSLAGFAAALAASLAIVPARLALARLKAGRKNR